MNVSIVRNIADLQCILVYLPRHAQGQRSVVLRLVEWWPELLVVELSATALE